MIASRIAPKPCCSIFQSLVPFQNQGRRLSASNALVHANPKNGSYILPNTVLICRARLKFDRNPSLPPPWPAHFKDTKPINREHSEGCCQWLEENRYRESHNDDKSGLCSSLTNVGTKTRHEYPALKRVTLLRDQSISGSQWTTLK